MTHYASKLIFFSMDYIRSVTHNSKIPVKSVHISFWGTVPTVMAKGSLPLLGSAVQKITASFKRLAYCVVWGNFAQKIFILTAASQSDQGSVAFNYILNSISSFDYAKQQEVTG